MVAVMNIVVWLRSLGLGRYEAAFRDNEIDETVLPNLTAEDLKDLGVSVVGHRRKLLDAIAATPNLAARLQGIAEPNTVVIGEASITVQRVAAVWVVEEGPPSVQPGLKLNLLTDYCDERVV